jgi:dCTP deaminase
MESLRLSNNLTGFANPKSTTGRLDILTRLLTDQSAAFDQITRGYQGPLYIEIVPRTFSIVVREGTRLNQIRFRRGGARSMASSEFELLQQQGIVSSNRRNIKEKLLDIAPRNTRTVSICRGSHAMILSIFGNLYYFIGSGL